MGPWWLTWHLCLYICEKCEMSRLWHTDTRTHGQWESSAVFSLSWIRNTWQKKRVTKWRTVKKWLSRQESRWRVLESMLLLTSTLTSWSKFLLLGFSINVSIFSCIGATFHSLERSRWWNNAIMPCHAGGVAPKTIFFGKLDIKVMLRGIMIWQNDINLPVFRLWSIVYIHRTQETELCLVCSDMSGSIHSTTTELNSKEKL